MITSAFQKKKKIYIYIYIYIFGLLLKFLGSAQLEWSVVCLFVCLFCKLRLMLTVSPSGLCHTSFCAFPLGLLWKYGTHLACTKMSPRSVGDLALLAGNLQLVEDGMSVYKCLCHPSFEDYLRDILCASYRCT